jgi:hypothetical protein
LLQAAVGIDPNDDARKRVGKDTLHQQLVQERIAELKSRIAEGGLREATVRTVLYIGMARDAVDERSFEAIRRIRQDQKLLNPLPIAEFKSLVREQYFMLLIDTAAAIAAIPSMLPKDSTIRAQAFELIKRVVAAAGAISSEGEDRLQQMRTLFTHLTDGEGPKLVPVLNGKNESPSSGSIRSGSLQRGSTTK